MKINGISGVNAQAGQMGMSQVTDSYSKEIQRQIANAQKQLQELSSNEDLTLEEKMKKRQEIQQEINNLNQQLRQRQIEQRKEQRSKGTSMDDMLGTSQGARAAKSSSKGSGLSQASMQAMISADSSMKQAQVQGSTATAMEGRAGVLKAEIKMDKSRGASTEDKEAELAEVEQKAVSADASQINTLADANQKLKEAAEAEQENKEEKADAKTEKRDSKAGKAEKHRQETGEVSGNKADGTSDATAIQTLEAPITVETATEDTPEAVVQDAAYTSIDIRL